ncbi:MAG TPA: glycosyltransferase [Solirubrobacteraceae bacterium]|nr:glycosyltransferase [Solirubrobacteraceae bacterium]
MTLTSTSRVDLHCHSTASQLSKLGIQRALGLPECATPPEEVYELAKRRGMDFVTITDHDTIDGVLELAGRPDVFVSEELTVGFRGEPQAVHVLCFGITPADHEWLQAHNDDVDACADYLHGHDIACALAHPFYAVEAPLTPRHRRHLARLFPVWETRNGSRARELNLPAAVYIETHGGTGVGGSDDHAGVDIGRTFTETPPAANVQELLTRLRDGRATARGDQGSAAKWAHAAMGLASRVFGHGPAAAPNPAHVLTMIERVMREGDARRGAIGADLGPDDARALLRSWLDAVELDVSEAELIGLLQADDFSHADLARRARRMHERKLQRAVDDVVATAAAGDGGALPLAAAGLTLFDACVAAIPYAPAAAFLGKEKAKLAAREGEPPRVALVADAVGSTHGVTRTLEQIRERGVPGFEVEVIGTDPNVDRRLSAVAEIDVPFYAGLEVGIPSLPAIVDALAEGRYDLVHLPTPGPSGVAAALVARVMALPIVGSYHTELATYAALRTGDGSIERAMNGALRAFYGQCHEVLSPSPSADASLHALGIPAARIGRWDRGVDLDRFDPRHRVEGAFTGQVNVLYAGRLTHEKGADLLADAFLAARERDPRLHLVLAGGGPEEDALRARLGVDATFLGWLEGEELPRAYASADLFLFASRTDTFGQVILEAQASGLPVVAVAEGGPLELVEDGRSGRLCPPEAGALADAVVELAANPALRERLGRAGAAATTARTWERALAQLSAGYGRALDALPSVEVRRAA